MKISEMIKELEETMKWNGDQEIEIMIYGKIFKGIEFNADEDNLYIEGYIEDSDDEDLFIRQHMPG